MSGVVPDIRVVAIVNDDPSVPFHCGSQAVDWESSNCHDCIHGGPDTDDDPFVWGKCAIRDAITCAFLGPWDPSVNEAMGHDGGIHPPDVCASRIGTPAHYQIDTSTPGWNTRYVDAVANEHGWTRAEAQGRIADGGAG